MDSKLRTVAFAALLIGLSSLVLLQASQTTVGLIGLGSAIASVQQDAAMPLQNANTTASNQTMPANVTMSTNGTVTPLASASLSSSVTENETTAVSYLEYQMTSMSEVFSAMSSKLDSMNQYTGVVTVIAEAGLIVAILAVVAAIAVARRADAMYREASQDQATGTPPSKK